MADQATNPIPLGWLKSAILWILKKAGESWIKEIVKQEMKAVQRLEVYNKAYTDFCMHLSYGLSRYYQSREESDARDSEEFSVKNRKWIIARLNEIRQARLRLLAVCGPEIRSLLEQTGTAWLNDPESFFAQAPKIEERLSEIASGDRQHVEQMF